jgi:hypothetical protein
VVVAVDQVTVLEQEAPATGGERVCPYARVAVAVEIAGIKVEVAVALDHDHARAVAPQRRELREAGAHGVVPEAREAHHRAKKIAQEHNLVGAAVAQGGGRRQEALEIAPALADVQVCDDSTNHVPC